VAITFDDGPHAVNTPKLLELFKKNDAKATFFVVGRGVGKCTCKPVARDLDIDYSKLKGLL
jgi:peptidoglycan/xylan/chitin deacetylase (PgdA/CDA1 family)